VICKPRRDQKSERPVPPDQARAARRERATASARTPTIFSPLLDTRTSASGPSFSR